MDGIKQYVHARPGSEYYTSDRFASAQEALADAVAEYDLMPGDKVQIGIVSVPSYMAGCPDSHSVIENLCCAITDEVPSELCEDYLTGLPDEAYKWLDDKLQEVVSQWFERFNLYPEFFSVKEVQDVEVPA